MNIKGKKLCDNCFAEIKNEPCEKCGYKKSKYKQEIGVLVVGTVLKQRYHIGKVLGRGGFGITYKAYDTLHEKVVAIKEYYPNGIAHRDTGTTQLSVVDSTQTESFNTGAEKFFEEAKTVSRFNGNPNIVGVYEFFYENSTVYYVMEYLEGCDLKTYIKNNGGRISQGQVVTLLNVITDALLITHSLNVLHRDISPDNIYIQKNGDVKLIDFGAARQVLAEQSKSLSVILKQGFAPLEQYQRKGRQGAWTDIYALGATCLYAVTAKVPDDATERIEESSIGTAEEYGVDEALWSVLEKCLAVRTADRYQSVLELKEALAKLTIAPVPFVMEKEENIPLTVAVAGNVTTEAGAIGATVAVDASSVQGAMTGNNETNTEQDDEEKKPSPILLFFKSVKGIIVIAAILVIAIVAVAVAAITSHGRKDDKVVGNDDLTTTDNISQEDTLPIASDNTTENDTTEDSTTENRTTENMTTETEPDTESSGEGMTEPTTPQPTTPPTTAPTTGAPTTKAPTQAVTTKAPTQAPTAKPTQTPTTVAPTTTAQTTVAPTTVAPTTVAPTEEPTTEETYVTNRYCSVYADFIADSYYASTYAGWYGGYYTGEWENGEPNGNGYFILKENSACTYDFTTYYILDGTWYYGCFDGNGTRLTLNCQSSKVAPTVYTMYWKEYVQEVGIPKYDGFSGAENIQIITGTWTMGQPSNSMEVYYAEVGGIPYYCTAINGSYDNSSKQLWNWLYVLPSAH